jgi:hypothetical protein
MQPSKSREYHRVTLVQPIVIEPMVIEPMPKGVWKPIRDHFDLGELKRYLTDRDELLPKVIVADKYPAERVTIDSLTAVMKHCHISVINVKGDSCVAVVTLDFVGGYSSVIDVLKAQYPNTLKIDGKSLSDFLGWMLSSPGNHIPVVKIGHERHQIVYYAHENDEEELGLDVVQRLIYRDDLPADPKYCKFECPLELNLRLTSEAYLGIYVSVMTRQVHDVENSVLLSAIMIVSAQARLRMLKESALQQLGKVRNIEWPEELKTDRLRRLAGVSAELRDLQVNLSFDVEDNSTMGGMIPSQRLEAFHQCLWKATKIDQQIAAVSQMLGRLENAVAAEEQAIAAIQQKREDWLRISVSVPLAFVSLIAVPVGLMLSFFSGQQKDLVNDSGFIDSRYTYIYVWIGVIFAIALSFGAASALVGHLKTRAMADRRSPRSSRDRKRGRSSAIQRA